MIANAIVLDRRLYDLLSFSLIPCLILYSILLLSRCIILYSIFLAYTVLFRFSSCFLLYDDQVSAIRARVVHPTHGEPKFLTLQVKLAGFRSFAALIFCLARALDYCFVSYCIISVPRAPRVRVVHPTHGEPEFLTLQVISAGSRSIATLGHLHCSSHNLFLNKLC